VLIADRLRGLREQKHLSQGDIEKRTGLGDETAPSHIQGKSATVQFIVRLPQQRLYFFPEPHGHGSFRPILVLALRGSRLRVLISERSRS
jgi:hypothetical protein